MLSISSQPIRDIAAAATREGMAVNQHTAARWATMILSSVVILAAINHAIAEKVSFHIPDSARAEGRVTIEYYRNQEQLKYQLAFSEVIDTETQRSKVSIGYVSYDPIVYYGQAGNILTLDKSGKCTKLDRAKHKFVPELDWVLKLAHTREELDKGLPPDSKSFHMGPSGIVQALARYTKFDHVETHRNVECQVTSALYEGAKVKNILFEILVPSLKIFDSPKMNFFTVRESIKNAQNVETNEKFSATITIDYFYTEEIDKTNVHQLDQLEMDLSLPLGRGCSEFLEPTRPSTKTQSFIMNYGQHLAQTVVSLAYDHKTNYLRKELVGRSVAIWDLNEDLFYHVDQTIATKLYNSVDIEVLLDVCSVLRVSESQTMESSSGGDNSIIRLPYIEAGKSVDVLEFLGAKEIYYLGQATVRDLPCQVFETILSEPPRIFDIDLRVELSQKADAFDYIVQFHIFKTNQAANSREAEMRAKQAGQEAPGARHAMVNDQFWPAQISLIKRHKESGRTQLYDQLDVNDFHWGLYGWTRKPSELFMVPECFNDENEQLRMSLALDFERLNLDGNQKVLRHNKYKLEKELLDDLFELLRVSRMHLTGFQLQLRPHNVIADLVISDRIEDKKLTYFGVGDLPNVDSYLNNRILLQNLASDDHGAESSCILLASHVAQISMVVYCPRRTESQGPTCTAIFGESQPVVKQPAAAAKRPQSGSLPASDPFEESLACQVYRFEPGKPPKAATQDVSTIQMQLADHKFTFDADTEPRVTFKGRIQDYDVSRELQLITINNYKYAPPSVALQTEATEEVEEGGEEPEKKAGEKAKQGVRSFEMLKYESLGDCIRMCDMDASCKSFSYCSDGTLPKGRCVLASLDLRRNKVEDQLVSAKVTKDNQILVRDQQFEYSLDLKSGCNIYERNFLSAFTQTDEILRIEPEIAQHFYTTPNAAECARWVQSLEEQMAEHHSAMFAYCANTNTCLVDEDLFGSLASNAAPNSSRNPGDLDYGDDADPKGLSNELPSDDRELSCQVYRRRYQTYFHISPRVLKRDDVNGDFAQMELQSNTVEECARACWDTFGRTCLSFDYCSGQSCSLIGFKGVKRLFREDELEFRPNCLHYKRDLNWDKLRRDHLIGRHNLLDLDAFGNESSPGSLLLNFCLLLVTGVLFVVGLALGRTINDRYDRTMARRRNDLMNEPLDPSQRNNFGFNSAGMGSPVVQKSSTSRISTAGSSGKFSIENEIYEDPDAIRLEDFSQQKRDVQADELSSGATIVEEKNESIESEPGHIGVPVNLINV